MKDNKENSKFKLLMENIFIYGLGGVISKLIPLIMLPLITRILPDRFYFGLSDLSTTIISFAAAFALLGIYDAMYRLFFEKEDEEYKIRVCSTSFTFTMITSVIVSIILLVCKNFIAEMVFKDTRYSYLVYICALATLVSATNSIVSAPTRMQNKRKIYLVANTVGPVLSYIIAIPMILKGYYVIALPLAALISALAVELSFYFINRKWFPFKVFDKKILRQLLVIGVPLLPNFLVYWVFNSSDKIMITNFIDVGASGVYSVGAKLGHISQLIYTAFAGGWQFFAFSTMKEKNQVESNSKIFEYLGVISFGVSPMVFALSSTIFKVVFSEEYYEGYIVAPYLFLAPLMQMLFQVIANQFLIIKKTWPNMLILLVGAIINVILNLTLIPTVGIEGAAIATLIGYVCSDIICCIVLYKMKLLTLSKKFLISFSALVIYIIFWRIAFISYIIISMVGAVIVSSLICLLYKNDISGLIHMIKKK